MSILSCSVICSVILRDQENKRGGEKRGTKLRIEREPHVRFQFCKKCCSLLDAGKDHRSTLSLDHRTFKMHGESLMRRSILGYLGGTWVLGEISIPPNPQCCRCDFVCFVSGRYPETFWWVVFLLIS